MKRTIALTTVVALLVGCSSTPPAPDWQVSAHGSLARYVDAFMTGNTRVADLEFDRTRAAVASSGKIDVLARTELTRCAAQVATLALEPCVGFERLVADAPPAEKAYDDYLAARLNPQAVALLPPAQRAVAGGRGDAAAVQAIADPFSRLVAAGVLFRAGRATPAVLDVAVRTASDQGWRRPLLAWLGVQLRRAQAAGAVGEAESIARRLAIVEGSR